MATEVDYALLADAAYTGIRGTKNVPVIPVGWEQLSRSQFGILPATSRAGFSAEVFRNAATGEVVISYQGTNPNLFTGDAFLDWTTNLATGLGSDSGQLKQAAQLYRRVAAAYGEETISFTGHSLGGGLASLMAVFFDRPAQVFAPAPFESAASVQVARIVQSLLGAAFRDQRLDAYVANQPAAFAAREQNVEGHYVIGEVVARIRTQSGTIARWLTEAGSAIVGAGNDVRNVLTGNSFANMLAGGAERDQIVGNEGDEVLIGGDNGVDGGDLLIGGLGNDTLHRDAQAADLQSVIDAGAYEAASGLKGDFLAGGVGDDVLISGAGADLVSGGSGNDTLVAGGGDDLLLGDSDYETADLDWFIRRTDDPVTGTSFFFGNSTEGVGGPAGGDTLHGGGERDILFGENGDDSLYGDAGDDLVLGGAGADQLFGGEGNDVLAVDAGRLPLKRNYLNQGRALLAVTSIVILNACQSEKTISFKEEVLLNSGQQVVVQKSIRYRKHCEALSCGWGDPNHTISLIYPNSERAAAWNENLLPLYIDLRPSKEGIFAIEWVLIATANSCEEYRFTDQPVPPYFQFIHLAGTGWKRVPLESQFLDREANLSVSINPDDPPADTLRLETKKSISMGTAGGYRIIQAKGEKIC